MPHTRRDIPIRAGSGNSWGALGPRDASGSSFDNNVAGGTRRSARAPGAAGTARARSAAIPARNSNLAQPAHRGHAGSARALALLSCGAHHVGKIVGQEDGKWIIQSGNDGNRVRTRPLPIGNAIAVRWGAKPDSLVRTTKSGRSDNRAAVFFGGHSRRHNFTAARQWAIIRRPRIALVMTHILKTPPERFADLPGFAWRAHSRADLPDYSGLSMSYLDEGPANAPVFLCLHGQPTWSYLYRRMIPHFPGGRRSRRRAGLFRFRPLHKPAEDGVYTFNFHRNSLLALVQLLDLKSITLVVQDSGRFAWPDVADGNAGAVRAADRHEARRCRTATLH